VPVARVSLRTEERTELRDVNLVGAKANFSPSSRKSDGLVVHFNQRVSYFSGHFTQHGTKVWHSRIFFEEYLTLGTSLIDSGRKLASEREGSGEEKPLAGT